MCDCVFQIGAFLIGIEIEEFVVVVVQFKDNVLVKCMVVSVGGCKLIIGVDWFDYFKGIDQCMFVYECYFEYNFEVCGKIVYFQVILKLWLDVFEYVEMQWEIVGVVGCINGVMSDFDWVFICYVNWMIKCFIFVGFFCMVNVGFVMLLCDGMNFVVKEFVVVQSVEDLGVFILL